MKTRTLSRSVQQAPYVPAFGFSRICMASLFSIINGLLLWVLLLLASTLQAQEYAFRKGIIVDSVPATRDSIPETFALYLPSQFEISQTWPAILIFDGKGRGRQALGMFREAAESRGYVLAASNNTSDSLSVTDNLLIANRMQKMLVSLFPIHKGRMYTAGQGTGGRIAAIVPSFINGMAGVVSLGADIPNTDILNERTPFYYLGIVGISDFNFLDMSRTRKLLNKMKFPNDLLVFEGVGEWPDSELLKIALDLFNVKAMSKGSLSKDMAFIRTSYGELMARANTLIQGGQLYRGFNFLEEIRSMFSGLIPLDSLDNQINSLKRDKLYRSQKRDESRVLLKESLVREDYNYYLEEDVQTYNFDNLGWWKYQTEQLAGYESNGNLAQKYMGQRLNGYLNALIEDQIDLLKLEKDTDEEALLFLYMLKTISAPSEYGYYLKIVSLSSKYEDYGTALFYLEELLKQGYKKKAELYALEHTSLLRITPEYNALIAKYLDEARYELKEQ